MSRLYYSKFWRSGSYPYKSEPDGVYQNKPIRYPGYSGFPITVRHDLNQGSVDIKSGAIKEETDPDEGRMSIPKLRIQVGPIIKLFQVIVDILDPFLSDLMVIFIVCNATLD